MEITTSDEKSRKFIDELYDKYVSGGGNYNGGLLASNSYM